MGASCSKTLEAVSYEKTFKNESISFNDNSVRRIISSWAAVGLRRVRLKTKILQFARLLGRYAPGRLAGK
jgi:hypothetical protein